MRSNPGDVPPGIDWPDAIEPTDAESRERVTKFETSTSKTKRQIGEELENFIEADQWYIDEITGSRQWPGIVVRWRKDGVDYAVACDAYTTKKANARAIYWWIHETRMREDRPVSTAHDAFAAAALPSENQTALPGEVEAIPPGGYEREPAHEVLDVPLDADAETVTERYRELAKEHHPDVGGDPERWARIKRAKETMTDE